MGMMSSQPMDIRMAQIEGSYHQVADRLNGIDLRLNGIDLRLNGIDRRLDAFDQKIDARFAQVDARFGHVEQQFMWVIGLIVTSWVTTILAVLLHR